jgi:hypothetical protein
LCQSSRIRIATQFQNATGCVCEACDTEFIVSPPIETLDYRAEADRSRSEFPSVLLAFS